MGGSSEEFKAIFYRILLCSLDNTLIKLADEICSSTDFLGKKNSAASENECVDTEQQHFHFHVHNV